MPVTMRQVAEKAGVSIKTVSRVVNDQGEISEETRQQVAAVIKELGYRPNMLARGLVTQRTYTIGLVITDIANPFFAEVARGVQDVARGHEYNVLLCNSDEDQAEEWRTLHSLAAQGVDGILIFPSYYTGDNLAKFSQHYRPLVVMNHLPPTPTIGSVLTDNEQGAVLAVNHLVHQGHRAIAMVAGMESSPKRARRLRGFLQAMAENGLTIPEQHISIGLPTLESGYERTLQLLTADPQITAIVGYNDLVALGAIRACQTLGRRVPQDCAVIGFDDIQLAALITPPLTTVRIDKYRLGQQAMITLLDMVENNTQEPPPKLLDVELIVRASA